MVTEENENFVNLYNVKVKGQLTENRCQKWREKIRCTETDILI